MAKLDLKAVEKRGSMGKYDMFERGRQEAKKLSKSFKKKHSRKTIKWKV